MTLVRTIRTLRRSPTFAAVSVLSLAVGIGANVAVFSIVNALLIRPLAVRDADRLVRIGRTTRDISFGSLSFPEYVDLRDGTTAFSDLIAHHPNSAILTVGEEPRQMWLEIVSANYFSGLGVRPILGRGFVSEDDRAPNASPVLVLSHELWSTRFGGDSTVIGRAVKLNGYTFTVVGVAPAGFRGTFAGFDIEAWAPAMMQPIALPGAGSVERRDDQFLMLIGRLKPGVSLERARGELAVAARRLALAQRDTAEQARLEVVRAGGVHPFVAQMIGAFLGLLQGIVFLVLLIACVNLANVLLVRASVRRRELAVRAALGAGRWRLARLLLGESLVIAVAGGALGVVLAVWIGRALERVDLPVGIPIGLTLGLDGRVIIAALGMTLLTALAFGAGPALAASRADALRDLRVGGATADRTRSRIRSALVAAQVTVATVLLVGSSLLLRSLERSRALDAGFDAAGVHIFSASPELLGYDEQRGRALWHDIAARAERVPGVQRVALALLVPLGSRGDVMAMAPAGERREPERMPYNIVAPGYFETLRIPFIAGRDVRATDDRRSADVVVISAAMARRFFGRENAVGRSLRIVDRAGHERSADVVGVVRDIKLQSMGEPPRPIAYVPFGQWYRADMVLHVRTGDRATGVSRGVVEQMHGLEPDLAVDARPMTREMAFSLIPLRVAGSVLAFAGLIGLFLASLGVFGLVAYAVSLRTREIGIRMALGAGRGAVTRLIALGGLRPVFAGLAVGLVLAAAAARLLRGILVGIGPSDPVSLLLVSLVLVGSALAALIVPIRRAVGVEPAQVLRAE